MLCNNISLLLKKARWLFAHDITVAESNCNLPCENALNTPSRTVWWSVVKGDVWSPYCSYPCLTSHFCDLWNMAWTVLFRGWNAIKANIIQAPSSIMRAAVTVDAAGGRHLTEAPTHEIKSGAYFFRHPISLILIIYTCRGYPACFAFTTRSTSWGRHISNHRLSMDSYAWCYVE